MISPHTPPGTKVVVTMIGEKNVLRFIAPFFHNYVREHWRAKGGVDLVLGTLLTVDSIVPNNICLSGFTCVVRELSGRYLLECFSPAALPGCLTDLLVSNKVPEDA